MTSISQKTPTEDIEILSVLKAAKLTGMSRNTITAAMDSWMTSGGRVGLAFIQPTTRRLIRRSSLRDWFSHLERRAAGRD